MENQPPFADIIERAQELADMGYDLAVLRFGEKVPDRPWKGVARLTREDIRRLINLEGPYHNFAIKTGASGVVVLDCDDEEAAAWVGRVCPPTPMHVTTPGGGLHAYFRENPELELRPRVKTVVDGTRLALDLRAGESIAVAPDAWSYEHRRRWHFAAGPVPPAELPVLPAEPFSESIRVSPAPNTRARSRPGSAGHIRDVTRWIMEVESIEGQGGSNQCFKVACRLVDAGFTWVHAWYWLRRWNERRAEPPWSERELRHKLEDAFERT